MALFALVAEPYAQAALAADRRAAAHDALRAAYATEPRLELLAALDRLAEPPASGGAERRLDHLAQQPSLGAAAAVLALETASWRPDTRAQLHAAVQRAARPLQRYRCAACGFEAHHYFWQCPGCQGWDTYPPRLLEQQ